MAEVQVLKCYLLFAKESHPILSSLYHLAKPQRQLNDLSEPGRTEGG
jgi:hypothetical protein